MPQIRPARVGHGEKITAQGVYQMPMGWYHADCCDGPSISSTGLRLIDLKTPLHYWDGSYLNPDRDLEDDSEEKKHYRLGRAAHTLSLEPETFHANFLQRPSVFDSWRTKDSQKWRADAVKEGKTVLDPVEHKAVVGVARALRRHPLFKSGILDGMIEVAIIWRDPKSGIWLKSRPDAIPYSAAMLTDLKVLRSVDPRAVENGIRGFGYDMQMALGGIGIETVLGLRIEEYALLAVENTRPHAIHVATIDNEMIYWARVRLRRSIDTFAECLKAGDWPGYEAIAGRTVGLTDWQRKRYDDEQTAGLLPQEF